MKQTKGFLSPSKLIFGMLMALIMIGGSAMAQNLTEPPRADNENHKKDPFRMIGNIWWVGHSQVGSFLIKTPKGHILIDTTSVDEAPWVKENLDKLGIKMKDIKIMLNLHPHAEHMGGFPMFKEATGAKIITSKLTADEMAVGGRTDFREDGREQYKPIKVDQIVEDGGKVEFGGVTLTAHITPGHTKGCTTYTTTVEEDGKKYNVVFVCSLAVSGPDRAPLFNNAKYPKILEDWEHTFKVMHSLPCDLLLYPRATTIHLQEKQARLDKGEKPNPFIDPAGCQQFIKESEALFVKLRDEQRAALKK